MVLLLCTILSYYAGPFPSASKTDFVDNLKLARTKEHSMAIEKRTVSKYWIKIRHRILSMKWQNDAARIFCVCWQLSLSALLPLTCFRSLSSPLCIQNCALSWNAPELHLTHTAVWEVRRGEAGAWLADRAVRALSASHASIVFCCSYG